MKQYYFARAERKLSPLLSLFQDTQGPACSATTPIERNVLRRLVTRCNRKTSRGIKRTSLRIDSGKRGERKAV